MKSPRAAFLDFHGNDERGDIQCFSSDSEASKHPGPVLVKPSERASANASQKRVHPCESSSQLSAPKQRPVSRGKHVKLRCGIAVLACICLLWTVWLILLTVAPNKTVNGIMHTSNFDEGTFWLLVDTPPHLLWPTVLGFSLVALGYVATAVQVLLRHSDHKGVDSVVRTLGSFDVMKAGLEKAVAEAATDPRRSRISSSVAKLAVSLSQVESPKRKLVNMGMKICDLVVEAILLSQILEAGPPLLLVGVFTTIIVTNALACICMVYSPSERTGLGEILLDLFFDFLIAVGYPIIVLAHCFSTFQFDHDKLAINVEVFPPGWFETSASFVANPVQTVIIHKSLRLLRVESVMDFFTRVGVNFIFCFRLNRLARRIQRSENLRSSLYPKKHRVAAASVVVLMVALIVFVEESVRTSNLACKPHPECVVKAHRWTLVEDGSLTQCPCLTLIDADIAPKTYAEWMHPRDMTDKVAQLAATGDLQTMQLINRYLPSFPQELRRCTKMTHLSFIYTHTPTLPTWTSEFTQLQYLHVEGTAFSSLVTLPDGMFDRMSSLAFLHLGIHPPLKTLPSFDGLSSLKSLALALLFSLAELPSFDKLQSAERVVLISLVSIDSLPDLTNLKKLRVFQVGDQASWCCNGFLGECDLHSPHCMVHPLWGTPAASCLAVNRTDDLPTQGTLDVLKRFSKDICGELILPGTTEGPPTEAGMDQCNGTMYRQCTVPGYHEAMCYNSRFMAISCAVSPFPIKMRRLQIERGVGDPCDPVDEAWLGCKQGNVLQS